MTVSEHLDHLSATTIGQRIRLARLSAGLSKEGLAAAADVVYRAVTYWEADTHDPSLSKLLRIAAATGAPVEWLATGAGEFRLNPTLKEKMTDAG